MLLLKIIKIFNYDFHITPGLILSHFDEFVQNQLVILEWSPSNLV